MSLNIKSSQESVEVWLSVPNTSTMLVRQTDIYFAAESGVNNYCIIIDEDTQYQQIDGFGGSLTDASCWLLKYKLTDQKRAEVMEDLFGQSGINISLLRQPIGASDFSWEAWTFDDTTNNTDDWSLNNFSLSREDAYIRPILDMAYKVNPGRIKIFATPWSPPAWMRSNKGLYGKGGYLRPECYNVYADYFVKYVKECEAKGIPVYAVTIQNEPQYEPDAYPGMQMSIQDEIGFIKDYIGPKFQQNGISTKIICFDHNFDDNGTDFAASVLASGAYNYCAGSAWHPYCAGNSCVHEKMTEVHNRYPDKDVWFTEAGSGTWIGDDSAQFADQMYHTIRSPRNWSKSVVFWNIALDQNAAPKLAGVDTSNSNRGFLTISSDSTDSVTRNTSYYSMGHTSKFVDPGAYRIESNSFPDDIEDVAYKNPDGSKVVVLSNRTPNQKSVKIQSGSESFTYTVPEKAAVTFKWRS
ncbi:MAG: glycoside hydrolase family 30 beta sandwich domain-containing protein [Nostoc sp.]|uniref:glycoside hydrolase family 30 protein n=1 Tax=Nostoc sp. TaxID=1180 RepID=UPI002FF4940B